MTADEARKAFKELKAQGMDDDEILGRLYMMFQDDVIDVDELEALCNVLGYEFTDEFRNMSPEDQKTKGYEEIEDEEPSDEEVEDAKEYDADEEEEPAEDEEDEESYDDKEEDEDESDDDKAAKLFGFGKK